MNAYIVNKKFITFAVDQAHAADNYKKAHGEFVFGYVSVSPWRPHGSV